MEFVCTFCDEKFATLDELQAHIKEKNHYALFIRKIYEDMTEESLLALFAEFECKKVKILKFPLDHVVGYALFESEEKFVQAFDALNKKKLGEDGKNELLLARPIYLSPAPRKAKKSRAAPKKKAAPAAAAAAAEVPQKAAAEVPAGGDTVFVANLPPVVSDKASLDQVFEGFKIVEYRFEGNKAIVKLENATVAQEAINSLTEATVEGIKIQVGLQPPKIHVKRRSAAKKNSPKKKASKKPDVIFDFPAKIRNLPYSLTSEEDLKKELPQLSFVGVDIKMRSKKQSKGFAVVGFKSEEERAAAEELKDVVIGGRKIVISKLVRRKEEAAAAAGKPFAEKEFSEFVGVIHNLPFDVTEESQIKEILGEIPYKFAYVSMRRGRSMGYAVVGFNCKEDLDNAIANVSGVNVNKRVIRVTLPAHKK